MSVEKGIQMLFRLESELRRQSAPKWIYWWKRKEFRADREKIREFFRKFFGKDADVVILLRPTARNTFSVASTYSLRLDDVITLLEINPRGRHIANRLVWEHERTHMRERSGVWYHDEVRAMLEELRHAKEIAGKGGKARYLALDALDTLREMEEHLMWLMRLERSASKGLSKKELQMLERIVVYTLMPLYFLGKRKYAPQSEEIELALREARRFVAKHFPALRRYVQMVAQGIRRT